MNWWLIIRTPEGAHAWPVWGEDDQPDEALINAARVATGFPAHDQWTEGSGYDVQLTLGDPHPTLLEQAAVGTRDDLSNVDVRLVTAHADARATAARQSIVDGAKAALVDLDDETLKAVLADPALAKRAGIMRRAKGG